VFGERNAINEQVRTIIVTILPHTPLAYFAFPFAAMLILLMAPDAAVCIRMVSCCCCYCSPVSKFQSFLIPSSIMIHSPTDCLVCLFPCARLIYTQSALATCPSNDGRWCGETNTARLSLLFCICGDNMGCGDVAVPTPR
jgi:hypothetical protein